MLYSITKKIIMKKQIFLSAIVFLLSTAFSFAQNTPAENRDIRRDNRDIRHDNRDIRHDTRDIRHDRRERNRDLREGKPGTAAREQHDINRDK